MEVTMRALKLILLDERSDGWFVGDTEIYMDHTGNRLSEDTAQAIGILEDRQFYSLRRCKMCQQLFVAHCRRSLCSDVCRAKNIKAHSDAATARRSERRARMPRRDPAIPRAERRRQKREGLKCKACRAPLIAIRSNRATCNSRCRQWHHRHPDELAPWSPESVPPCGVTRS
jgi:hypothetical protein